MARASTTSDVFNAVAEPRRREIVALLADGRQRSVGQIVDSLGLAQSAVSKHLGVLRTVGVVTVENLGKERYYALNPQALKPLHDWVKPFEQFWTSQLDRIKQRAERKAAERAKNN
jgi:DNA-binding transcriptional ArsR family regulator